MPIFRFPLVFRSRPLSLRPSHRRFRPLCAALVTAASLALLVSPAFAHGGGGKDGDGGGGGGGQQNAGAQPVQVAGGKKGGTKLGGKVYKPRAGTFAVSVGVMGPPSTIHVEASYAMNSWLELGARLAVENDNFSAGSGGTMTEVSEAASLFARWLPWALHTPYVEAGIGVVVQNITGTDNSSLGYNKTLAFKRDSFFGAAHAALGYAFRPGGGLTFSAGFGIRKHIGSPSKATYTETGAVSEEEAAPVVAAMHEAAGTNHGISPYGEMAIGWAF